MQFTFPERGRGIACGRLHAGVLGPAAWVAALAFLLAGASAAPAQAGCPDNGRVGEWHFSGDGSDDSGCGNFGSTTTAALTGDYAGTPNSAYAFNGTGDNVDFGISPTLEVQIPATISLMMSHDCSTGNHCVLFENDSDDESRYWGLTVLYLHESNRLYAHIGDGGIASQSARRSAYVPVSIPPASWVHVAVVFHTPTHFDFYVDGVELDPASVVYGGSGGPIAYDPVNSARIGIGGAELIPYDGVMDEVYLFGKALTPEQIAALDPRNGLSWPGEVHAAQKIGASAGGFTGTLSETDVFGDAVAALGDLDGDGISDLAVGARLDDGGGVLGADRGAVYILFLDTDGTVKSHRRITQGQGGFGGILTNNDNFGSSLAAIGDLDGDGVTDLAVGAEDTSDGGARRGAVWILFLNPDGTVKDEQKISETQGGLAGTWFDNPPGVHFDDNDHFGSGLAAVGDLDRDGNQDLAVVASGDDDGSANAGAIWILFLNSDGTVHARQKISRTVGGFDDALVNSTSWVSSVGGIGDVDGDGIPDLAAGEPSDSDGGTARGAVWVLLLNEDGSVRIQQKISSANFGDALPDGGRLGWSVGGAGDLDGDGVPDLVAGSLRDPDGGTARGAVWVIFLHPNGNPKGEWKISSTQGGFPGPLSNGDFFGSAVAPLGDLDGDGRLEVAAGASGDNVPASNAGAVWILSLDGSDQACGDGVVDPGETCDDGNTSEFDACSSVCEVQDRLKVFGSAGAGVVEAKLDGVTAAVSTSAGQSAATVAGLLETAFSNDPTLSSLGVDVHRDGDVLYADGIFSGASSNDPTMTVSATPGVVVDEVKISALSGGFAGSLGDGDAFGSTLASLGDLDGDGIGDVAVGAPLDGTNGAEAGAVWILFLNGDGSVKSERKIASGASGFGGVVAAGDRFGTGLAGLGDLNGDGVPDLAVGAPRADDGGTDRGVVFLLFLASDGTVASHAELRGSTSALILDDSDQFGAALAALRIPQQPETVRLLAGVPGGGIVGGGNALLLELAPNGAIVATEGVNAIGDLDANDSFGTGLAALGDIDGDGIGDIAVGASLDDDAHPDSFPANFGAGRDRGAIYTFRVNASGSAYAGRKVSDTTGGFRGFPIKLVTNVQPSRNYEFGRALGAAGDLDGDGIADLIVGASSDDGTDGTTGSGKRGAAWVLFLDANRTIAREQLISANRGGLTGPLDPGDAFGAAIAYLDDFNGDRRPRVVIGAPGDDDGGTDRGALYVLELDGAPPPFCGDAIVTAPETCDDANTTSGDGCYATCRVESEFLLTGTAQGGSVTLVVSGVGVIVGTSAGETADQVIAALVSAINATPSLQMLGVSAIAAGDTLITDGNVDSFDIQDPGLSNGHLTPVPAMHTPGLIALCALLMITGAFVVLGGRRRFSDG